VRIKAILLAASAGSALLIPLPASAQTATEDVAEGRRDSDSGDIIVTARKREESILNVPVVANVISADTLQQAAIRDLQGVATRVPGLFISQAVSTIGAQVHLRGIGTSALNAGVDQSVSLSIDNQQFSQGLAFKTGLFDVARVEVLKGPQALFYGKNSPGGVIALTTADPGADLEVIARLSYEFEADEKRAEFIVSGPVSNTLGLRLATAASDRTGYFKNIAVNTFDPNRGGKRPDPHSDGNRSFIVRGTAVWEPTDVFRARLKANIARDNSQNPNGIQFTNCPSGTGPSVIGVQFLAPDCKLDRRTAIADVDPRFYPGVPNNGRPFTKIRQDFGVLDLGYDVTPDVMLSSTTTYYKNSTDTMIHGIYQGVATILYAANDFHRRDITQEVRIESDWVNSPVNFLLGGYYQNADMSNDIIIGGNTLFVPATLARGTHDIDIETKSLFGQLRYKPVETLELAGGVRWTHEARSNSPTTVDVFGAFTGVPGTVMNVAQPKLSSKNWAPEFTVTFRPTDDLTVFGALKQAYKSGSYDIVTPVNPGENKSFGDERVRGGEVGIKARLLDRQLNVNTAFYHYKFSGLQVGVSQPAQGIVPITRTVNAGAARTLGVDFDASFRPHSIDGLSLNLAANWNKAKFLRLTNIPCYGGQTIAAGCNLVPNPTRLDPVTGLPLFTAQNLSGIPLEKAPEWQFVGGFDYETTLTDRLDILFGASAQHSSSWIAPIGRRADFRQSGYTMLNAYVTLAEGQERRWELSLIGNNLTDKLFCAYSSASDYKNSTILTNLAQTTGGVSNAGPLNPAGKIDETGCISNPGRQVMVRLTLRPATLF
jgi:iron complex outermembrane recepter protein